MAGKGQKKSTSKAKVKVGKLKVNKETVKDLTDKDQKQVKGGARRINGSTNCTYGLYPCQCK